MNAPLTETSLSYQGPPPLLIAATSPQALRRAKETADCASMHCYTGGNSAGTCQSGVAGQDCVRDQDCEVACDMTLLKCE